MSEVTYAVVRQNWRATRDGHVRLPGYLELATFDCEGDAQADVERRTREFWTWANPFRFGHDLTYVSCAPLPLIHDWLQERGFDCPSWTAPRTEWAEWWATESSAWPIEDIRHNASIFDKLDPYRYVPEPNHIVHAVGGFGWRYDEFDIFFSGESNGFQPLYMNRDDARLRVATESARAAGQRRRNREQDGYEYYSFDHSTVWERTAELSGVTLEESISGRDSSNRFEVYSVPVFGESPARGKTVYAVIRKAFQNITSERMDDSGYVYVAIHDSKTHAEAAAWERDRAERLWLNPFRFGENLSDITSIPPHGLAAMLNEIGIVIPMPSFELSMQGESSIHAFVEWWTQVGPWASEAQRNLVWDLLDQLRLYDVRAVSVE